MRKQKRGVSALIYVMSDLHGCYDKYRRMLQKIQLSDSDELLVLGDVIDRGEDGIAILQDMMARPNVFGFLGNHEYTMTAVLGSLGKKLPAEKVASLQAIFRFWLEDGGAPTFEAYRRLAPKEQEDVLAYINGFSLFDEVTLGERVYFLSHAGIDNYVPGKSLFDYEAPDMISGRMDYSRPLFADKFTVSGHTPTGLIDPASSGRIFRQNRHFAIDCGAVFGKPLGCLCLDTEEEFYVE